MQTTLSCCNCIVIWNSSEAVVTVLCFGLVEIFQNRPWSRFFHRDSNKREAAAWLWWGARRGRAGERVLENVLARVRWPGGPSAPVTVTQLQGSERAAAGWTSAMVASLAAISPAFKKNHTCSWLLKSEANVMRALDQAVNKRFQPANTLLQKLERMGYKAVQLLFCVPCKRIKKLSKTGSSSSMLAAS